MTRVHYKDAVGAFVVFDASRDKTFETVGDEVEGRPGRKGVAERGFKIPCLLLANKCDLVQRNGRDEGLLRDFARQNGFNGCLYTSPKDNINIEQATKLLVKEIMKRQQNLDDDEYDRHNDTIIMTDHYGSRTQANKRSCCN